MRAREIIMKIIFLLCACVSIIAVAAIINFLIYTLHFTTDS